MTRENQYPGLYRGEVANNIDPSGKGRVQIKVPSIFGDNALTWAMPCTPYAGDGVGHFFIPPNNAQLWIMFEGGKPETPVWMGCFWGTNDGVPASPAVPQMKVLKTDTATITINDGAGPPGVTVETDTGMKIAITPSGIEISNGLGAVVKLEGPKTSVNGSALEVT